MGRIYQGGGTGYVDTGAGGGAPSPSSGGTQYAFVFDMAATPGANVYATWATLYAAMSAIAGPKLVEVIGNAEITGAGPYDLQEVTFVPSDPGVTNLGIADGVTIDPCTLHFADGLNVAYLGTSGPCMTASSGGHGALIDLFLANLSCPGGQPFLLGGAGAHAIVVLRDHSMMGDGANPVLAGAVNVLVLDGSNIAPNALAAGVQSAYDDTSNVGTPQAGSVKMASQAASVAYNGGSPWGGSPPTEAGDALNRIAAILSNHAALTGPGLAPVPATTYGVLAVITGFTMSAEGSGKLRVQIDTAFTSTAGAGNNVILGVAAVTPPGPPPAAPDYTTQNFTTGPNNASSFAGLLCDYGSAGSFPPALVPGQTYDIYAMITANVSPAADIAGGDGNVIAIQEQL